MKKHIANIITGSRIVFSLPLLFISVSSVWFYAFYMLCGFTDMIDGTIARKMGSVSKFGARLDTVSDFVFMLICAIKILPILHISIWLWMWIALIAIVKIFNIMLAFIRKKKLISIHSMLNKITGLALFLLPLLTPLIPTTYSLATICVLASVSTMQEVCLVVKGQDIL